MPEACTSGGCSGGDYTRATLAVARRAVQVQRLDSARVRVAGQRALQAGASTDGPQLTPRGSFGALRLPLPGVELQAGISGQRSGPAGLPGILDPCSLPGLTLDQRIALGCLELPTHEAEIDPCAGLTIAEKLEAGCLTVGAEAGCPLGQFDPGPPPMSEWYQEAIPGCFNHDDAYYQAAGDDCARSLVIDTCIRPCELPPDWQIDLSAGLFDIEYQQGAPIDRPGMELVIATAWAFLLQNIDLLRFCFCMGSELEVNPNIDNEPQTVADIDQCMLETLLGVRRLRVYFEHDRGLNENGEVIPLAWHGNNGTLFVPNIGTNEEDDYSAMITDQGRICWLIQLVNRLVHEMIHSCGSVHRHCLDAGRGCVPNPCELQTIVANNLLMLLTQRYPCASGCATECNSENLAWNFHDKGGGPDTFAWC